MCVARHGATAAGGVHRRALAQEEFDVWLASRSTRTIAWNILEHW
jgi:hypothetical protein